VSPWGLQTDIEYGGLGIYEKVRHLFSSDTCHEADQYGQHNHEMVDQGNGQNRNPWIEDNELIFHQLCQLNRDDPETDHKRQ